jgi:hypothetical protein
VTPAAERAFGNRLSPEFTNGFAGAHNYFPETDISRRRMKGAVPKTGIPLQDLVRVDYPPLISGGSRVQSNPNLILVRAGPFHELKPPTAEVSRVWGTNNSQTYTLDELKAKLKDKPGAYEKYVTNMVEVKAELDQCIRESGPSTTQFFWLPDFYLPNARILNTLTDYRYSAGVSCEIYTNQIVYNVIFAPAWGEGTIGGSYNPHQGPGVSGGLKFARLWKANDSLQVQANVALHDIQGSLGYDVDYHTSLDNRTTLHLNPYGEADHDEKFRLGGLSHKPFRLQEESGGVAHVITHTGDLWQVKFRDEVFWQHFRLDSRQTGVSESADNGLRFHHQESWLWNISKSQYGSRHWQASFNPAFDYAPDAGWQHSFWVADLGGKIRVDFSGTSGNTMYVSLEGSAGTESKNVPPISLFRLGDDNRLLGLDPGEFTGRSYTHVEADYGISVSYLIAPLLPKSKDDEDKANPLDGIFLSVLTEFGTVANAGDFRALHDSDSNASSFGLALGKEANPGQPIGFRLGYAYSPDSMRHSGRFFTAAVFNF